MGTTSWYAHCNVVFASGKSMSDVFCDTPLAVVNVYQMTIINDTHGAFAGAMTNMRIYRTTTGTPSGGTAMWLTALADVDPLPLEVTVGTGRTPIRAGAFRQFYYAGDEWDMGAYSMPWMHTIVPYNIIWKSYENDSVQPIVCRNGFGAELRQEGTLGSPLNANTSIEFTVVR